MSPENPGPSPSPPADSGIVSLPYLFDRPRSAHPWLAALAELDCSTVLGEPQVTANWRMDHRLDADRESVLLAPGGFPQVEGPGGVDFAQARGQYFPRHLCRPAQPVGVGADPPAYLAPANGFNRIPAEQLSPNHSLLHLASLNALLRRALSGGYDAADLEAEIELATSRPLPTPMTAPAAAQVCELIAATAQTEGEAWTSNLAGLLSNTLGPNEPHWWAAFAYEVDDAVAGTDWTEAAIRLGLGHLPTGDWMLAWRYAPQEAGPLYRPTVLETADNSFHFPSPPGMGYGITMPLADGRAAARELIHAPLKGDACARACLGRLGRIERSPISVNTEDELRDWYRLRRRAHRRHLSEGANDPTTHWITRHRHLP